MEPQDRRKQALALGLVVVALAACSAPRRPQAPEPAAARAPRGPSLAFIEDDYERALGEARAKRRPIFVDSWAPWCHSCLSLRSYVLTDPSLAAIADDYVWLSIDTEKESNAAFVAKFTHEALPTLWVIAPAEERVVWRWSGTLTVRELASMLGERPAVASPFAERARELSKTDESACARLAAVEAPRLPRGTPRADLIATGLGCARGANLEPELGVLLDLALGDAADGEGALLADDRSALYEEAVETKRERGDERGAREVAARWAELLEREAARAKTPAARAVFDAHRLSAYLALGEPARAVPTLEQSERDFPGDYNPPARLAVALLAMGRVDEASAAVERATSRVYGPRAMRVFAVAADVARARGDRRGERHALEEALARTQGSVLTRGQKKVREGIAKRLDALAP